MFLPQAFVIHGVQYFHKYHKLKTMKKLLFLLLLSSSCTPALDNVKPTNVTPPPAPSYYKTLISTAKENTLYHLQTDISPIFGTTCSSQLAMLDVWVGADTIEGIKNADWIDTLIHPHTDGKGTFIAMGGWHGTGTASGKGKIDTEFNPHGSLIFTQNSCSMGTYVFDRQLLNTTDISGLSSSTFGNEVQVISTTPSIYCNSNSVASTNGNDVGTGLHAFRRWGANSSTSTIGGYPLPNNFTTPSSAVPNQKIYVGCRAITSTYPNSAFSKYSSRTHYFDFAGSGQLDIFLLNSIMEEYFLKPLGLSKTKRLTLVGDSYWVTNARALNHQITDYINDYNNLDLNVQGFSGKTTLQVLDSARNKVKPYQKPYISKDVYLIKTLTNDAGTAISKYQNIVRICDSIRAWSPLGYIMVMTQPPKTGVVTQNDHNLTDTMYINGKIRSFLVQSGKADAICDVADDSIIGWQGTNNNPIYYNGLHWTTAGSQRAVDNKIGQSIQTALY